MVKEKDAIGLFSLDRIYIVCYKVTMSPKQVRKIREVLELTQQQLADFIGASQVAVARWETGVHKPRGANLKALKELAQKAAKKR
jgi:DNA-binding transcriptional regulator YiaG